MPDPPCNYAFCDMSESDDGAEQQSSLLPYSVELVDSIGLERRSVRVVEHDDRWPAAFAEVAASLAASLPPDIAQIEHVGSTSVPGLSAKPILDIAVGLRNELPHAELVTRLQGLGLEYLGDFKQYGGRLFLAENSPNVAAVHIHVVAIDDPQWERYLAFRDGLRADPQLAAEYTSLKLRLASDHQGDRTGYTEAKFDFVLRHAEQLAARRR